jgi:hypothetical protein
MIVLQFVCVGSVGVRWCRVVCQCCVATQHRRAQAAAALHRTCVGCWCRACVRLHTHRYAHVQAATVCCVVRVYVGWGPVGCVYVRECVQYGWRVFDRTMRAV